MTKGQAGACPFVFEGQSRPPPHIPPKFLTGFCPEAHTLHPDAAITGVSLIANLQSNIDEEPEDAIEN
jgi:hypothetical protein